MRRPTPTLLLLALLSPLAACDKREGGGAAAAAAAQAAAGGPAAPAAAPRTSRFERDVSKKGCELLPPDAVASAFGVPADKLRQIKIAGCIYSWSEGDQTLEARVSMIRAHKTEEAAKTWFGNATRDRTAAEVKADLDQAMAAVKKRADRGKLGDGVTADTVDKVGGLVAEPEGTRYEDVEGVGDEARVQLGSGSMWVRVQNVTFTVSGYKGAGAPRPDVSTKDVKEIVRRAREAQRTWMAETVEERKAGARKVAEIVLERLGKL